MWKALSQAIIFFHSFKCIFHSLAIHRATYIYVRWLRQFCPMERMLHVGIIFDYTYNTVVRCLYIFSFIILLTLHFACHDLRPTCRRIWQTLRVCVLPLHGLLYIIQFNFMATTPPPNPKEIQRCWSQFWCFQKRQTKHLF